MRIPILVLSSILWLFATTGLAQPASERSAERPGRQTAKQATALRLTAGIPAPVLDGRLDDPAWARAEAMTDFIQREPNPGEPSPFRTTGRVVVGDDAIYVGIEAIDPEPGGIVGRLTRRDQMSQSDWIGFMIDSDRDKRNAYMFLVNPTEVKVDGIVTNGAEDDLRWDAVWDVEAEITEEGWVAEFRVPLSMLRFSTQGEGVWGFQLGRIIQRLGETSFWAAVPAQDPNFVTYFGEVGGFGGLHMPRRLEVLPYAATQLERGPGSSRDPFFEETEWDGNAGVDLKYGVTSNLTLDATINPDFGQVEADPSQVNLSAFETFFEERRPFFIEGADIFRMSLGVGDGDVETLFYTRRIGRAPQAFADSRGGFVDAPFQTSILGAAKLSGRTAGGWSIGVLDAVTGEEEAHVVSDDGARFDDVVEPLTNYGVVRLRRDYRDGGTQVGLMGTTVHRRLDGTGLEDRLRSSAYSTGLDFTHRFAENFRFSGKVLGTSVHGSEEAILRTQLSSARFFQRPDVDHVEVDSSRTSLSGWSAVGEIQKESGGHWRYAGFVQARSPGFEPNDVGFMLESDYWGYGGFAGYRILEPRGIVRRAGINMNAWTFENFGGLLTARGGNVNGNAQFKNFWNAHSGIGLELDNWSTDALRGGPNIREPGEITGWHGFSTDSRKPFQLGVYGDWGVESESGGWRWAAALEGTWQAAEATRVTMEPFYRDRLGGWQFVSTPFDADGDPRYVFADIRQKTFGLIARVEHTFTPRLSVQLYAQPFVSAGEYTDFKEVADARAESFDERFAPLATTLVEGRHHVDEDGDGESEFSFGEPDFNVREFRSNVVVRWEYRPGSTVFLVWQQSRDSFVSDPRFQVGEDVGDLFGAHPRNVFLVKVNSWLNL